MPVQSAHAQTFQVIHNFAGGLDGAEPTSGLTFDAAGSVFELSPGKPGSWTLTVVA